MKGAMPTLRGMTGLLYLLQFHVLISEAEAKDGHKWTHPSAVDSQRSSLGSSVSLRLIPSGMPSKTTTPGSVVEGPLMTSSRVRSRWLWRRPVAAGAVTSRRSGGRGGALELDPSPFPVDDRLLSPAVADLLASMSLVAYALSEPRAAIGDEADENNGQA